MTNKAFFSRRRAMATFAAMLAGTCAASGVATAQTYPNRLVTIVVPFPPGGTTDITARMMATEMSAQLGQTFIVENKSGVNGTIGSAQVAKAAPDGYTLLMSGIGSNAINHGIYKSMPYDSRKDFAHISIATSGPNVLIAHPGFPARTLKEFVEVIKANPGKYNYASAGIGASGHLAMELLKKTAGLDIQHIPYRGGGPAMQDLLSGKVSFMFINQDLAFTQAQGGTVRALGVASRTRSHAAPDVPTIAEQGFPGFEAVSWNGLSAPAGTPKPVIDALNAAAAKALKAKVVQDTLVKNGFVIEASTPERYTGLIASEIEKWTKVAKDAGVALD